MESGQLDLVKFRSSWRCLVTWLMDQACVGPLELHVGTTRLLVCRDAGEAQTLPVLWHPGFAVICQDSPLASLRSL